MCRRALPLLAVLGWVAGASAEEPGSCPFTGIEVGQGQRLELHRTDSGIHIALRGSGGEPLAEQTIPSDRSCDELRHTVAAIVGVWELSLRPGSLEPPPLPQPPETVAKPPSAPVSLPWRLDVGAAVLASESGAGVTLAGLASALATPPGWAFELELSLFGEGTRAVTLGAGDFDFSRFGFAAGPGYRFQRGAVSVDLDALAWVSLLTATGVGLPAAQSQAAADFGFGPSLQLAVQLGGWTPFAGAWGVYWLPDQAAVGGTSLSVTVPNWELFLGLGLRFAPG